MPKLTNERITELASRKNVRRIAVSNFLSTVDANEKQEYALANLDMDALSYKWNAPTVKAIRDGIMEHFKV